MNKLEEFADQAIRLKASDIHFQTGFPPCFRIHGDIVPLFCEKITEEDINDLKDIVLEPNKLLDLDTKTFSVDASYSLGENGRLRINFAKSQDGHKISCRIIPNEIPTIDGFGMPAIFKSLAEKQSGMIIVAGTTGSGKSTTIAAMIEHINEYKSGHVITIEDPIEFVHKPSKCIFTRREIGSHVLSFADGLKAAMRQDPDIILVGEMRDQESIKYGIQAAETGHLVFSTLHSRTCEDVPERIISTFPMTEQDQIRNRISEVGLAFIAQVLAKRCDIKGRIAAFEILILTPAARNIIRKERSFNLDTVMDTGSGVGMITLTKSLIQLYEAKKIDAATLLQEAPNTDRATKYIADHLDPSDLQKIPDLK